MTGKNKTCVASICWDIYKHRLVSLIHSQNKPGRWCRWRRNYL